MHSLEMVRQPISTSFRDIPRQYRHAAILNQPLTVSFQTDEGITADARLKELQKLEALGIRFFGIDVIFASVVQILHTLELTIPHAEYADGPSLDSLNKSDRRTVMTEQKNFFDFLFQSLSITFEERGTKIVLRMSDGTQQDITRNVYQRVAQGDHAIDDMRRFQGLTNRAMGLLKKLSEDGKSFAMVVTSPSQAMTDGPVIGVNGLQEVPLNWRKDADAIVTGPADTISLAILKEMVRYQHMQSTRAALKEGLITGEIVTEPEFKVEQWPKHPLMNYIKTQAIPFIADETEKSGVLCDEQDIRYQTIFRLTTFPFNELFHNGDALVAHLKSIGVYDDWHKILSLVDADFNTYQLNEELIREVAREQLIIINDRLSHSPLPVKEILTKSGIFAEDGWRMEKEGGQVFAVRYDDSEQEIGRKIVRFEAVDHELASAFHHAFHYIHTPRTGQAYGFFLEDETIPFSVLALEPIDRDYKHNMLLMRGYDPKQCVDLSRLYSRPGTPRNASSTMFSLVFSDIKTNQPEIQAILSAFMPTYATGLSMLSGGFDHPVLVKPNGHTFGAKEVDGQVVYEHLTKRRRKEAQSFVSTHPDMPMLPVVELMTRLKEPRFEPFEELDGKMVVCTT